MPGRLRPSRRVCVVKIDVSVWYLRARCFQVLWLWLHVAAGVRPAWCFPHEDRGEQPPNEPLAASLILHHRRQAALVATVVTLSPLFNLLQRHLKQDASLTRYAKHTINSVCRDIRLSSLFSGRDLSPLKLDIFLLFGRDSRHQQADGETGTNPASQI